MSRRQKKLVKPEEPNLKDQYDQLMELCVSLKTKIDTLETDESVSEPAKIVQQRGKRGVQRVRSSPPVPVKVPSPVSEPTPALASPPATPVEKIKILILSTFKHGKEKFDLRHIRSQYQILAYQLDKYIKVNGENRFTVMHQTLPIRGTSTRIQRLPEHKNFDCVEVDFILVCDNRGLHYRPPAFTEKLRSRARKGIFTFASNNAMVGGEDVLFYMVPNGKRNKRHCKYVGWTCDDTLCSPKQVKGRLQILIDHNYYGRHQNMLKNDLTEDITAQVCEFAKKHKQHQVVVRRFIAGGVETVDINNPQKMDKYVQGAGLSYEDACAEYSKTDIFIVTHKECMGLSVLESAMSGALVLTPEEYIKEDLLRHVHHIPFQQTIDWNHALENIDAKKARNKVIKFNINNFVKKILVVMSRMDYLRETNFEFKNSHN
ncbi:hypothetical protein N9064_00755 [bacterium]|nr:hypothetical protein [bacterium]